MLEKQRQTGRVRSHLLGRWACHNPFFLIPLLGFWACICIHACQEFQAARSGTQPQLVMWESNTLTTMPLGDPSISNLIFLLQSFSLPFLLYIFFCLLICTVIVGLMMKIHPEKFAIRYFHCYVNIIAVLNKPKVIDYCITRLYGYNLYGPLSYRLSITD